VKTLAPLILAALVVTATGCGSSPAAPNTGTTTTTPSTANLTGTWTGTGKDAQGAETFRWTVTQTGSQLTGQVALSPVDPNDGSCGSCHKQKNGTLTGTISGGAVTLTLDFPSGGTDITPLCGITMNASTSDVASGRIAAAYTGTTTCEGLITDGTFTVTR
jgi:hypothetical protein